jgi:hypothetical protein
MVTMKITFCGKLRYVVWHIGTDVSDKPAACFFVMQE